MNWKNFSSHVPDKFCSTPRCETGNIARLFGERRMAPHLSQAPHKWYPCGINNNQLFHGYRYVDMNHSFFGAEPVLISEASCCIIVVLLDKSSQQYFCAHISAANDRRYKAWYLMKFDLQSFFRHIDKNIDRAKLYLFSNNLYKGEDGTLEQRIFLKLFGYVFNHQEMLQLASSTRFIEGENGITWNPYCAITLSPEEKSGEHITTTVWSRGSASIS